MHARRDVNTTLAAAAAATGVDRVASAPSFIALYLKAIAAYAGVRTMRRYLQCIQPVAHIVRASTRCRYDTIRYDTIRDAILSALESRHESA